MTYYLVASESGRVFLEDHRPRCAVVLSRVTAPTWQDARFKIDAHKLGIYNNPGYGWTK